MEHCFLRLDDDAAELNFFGQQPVDEEDVIYYSQTMIDCEEEMKDDYEAYFDV